MPLPPSAPIGAASVVNLIEPKIEANVSLRSIDDASREERRQQKAAGHKAQSAQILGTRQLKRKASTVISEIPRYKRGFVWNKSLSLTPLSPSALATETAPPLASPPSHLINDPKIQSTLHAMRDYIRVETPFNVDRFEAILYDHPNQPFVKSVMDGLHYGFWPFDEGNWNEDNDDIIENYATKEEDFKAIHAFRDDEIQARRWSEPFRLDKLLPRTVHSPTCSAGFQRIPLDLVPGLCWCDKGQICMFCPGGVHRSPPEFSIFQRSLRIPTRLFPQSKSSGLSGLSR